MGLLKWLKRKELTEIMALQRIIEANKKQWLKEISRLVKENSDLAKKVRQQTEADLVMVSLKIIKATMDGDYGTTKSLKDKQMSLQQDLAAQQSKAWSTIQQPTP